MPGEGVTGPLASLSVGRLSRLTKGCGQGGCFAAEVGATTGAGQGGRTAAASLGSGKSGSSALSDLGGPIYSGSGQEPGSPGRSEGSRRRARERPPIQASRPSGVIRATRRTY